MPCIYTRYCPVNLSLPSKKTIEKTFVVIKFYFQVTEMTFIQKCADFFLNFLIGYLAQVSPLTYLRNLLICQRNNTPTVSNDIVVHVYACELFKSKWFQLVGHIVFLRIAETKSTKSLRKCAMVLF